MSFLRSLLSAAAVFTLPNIPSSSLVILVTILASLGVAVNYVGLLFAIDWFMYVQAKVLTLYFYFP